MGDEAIKLLEDRVLRVVARIRTLRDERDRLASDLEALRAQLDSAERGRAERDREDRDAELREMRRILTEAISELREEAGGSSEAVPGPAVEPGT